MENKKIPEIRFKGFNGDWEQYKLSEVAERFDNLRIPVAENLRVKGSNPYYGANGIQDYVEGFTHQGEFVLVAEDGASDLNDYPIFCVNGDIWVNNHAHVLQIKPGKGTNQFLSRTLKQTDIKSILVGGGRAKLNADTMMKLVVMMPSLNEQKQIGSFFEQLDTTITLHQRKIAKLQQIKDGLLLKMFPREGEVVPEIRFEGFTDPWEQRKFKEIGKVRSGVGFPESEQGGTTGIPFYKVSDMNLDGNEIEMTCANNYVSEEQILERKWTPITEVPAVIFAKVGAAVMLNRKRLCRSPFLLDNNTMSYSLDTDVWDTEFSKTLFGTIDLTSLVQVGALPSYNARDVEEIKVMIPSLNEQKKIGEFFQSLDQTITLHQRKIAKLQQIKDGLLIATEGARNHGLLS